MAAVSVNTSGKLVVAGACAKCGTAVKGKAPAGRVTLRVPCPADPAHGEVIARRPRPNAPMNKGGRPRKNAPAATPADPPSAPPAQPAKGKPRRSPPYVDHVIPRTPDPVEPPAAGGGPEPHLDGHGIAQPEPGTGRAQPDPGAAGPGAGDGGGPENEPVPLVGPARRGLRARLAGRRTGERARPYGHLGY